MHAPSIPAIDLPALLIHRQLASSVSGGIAAAMPLVQAARAPSPAAASGDKTSAA